MRDRERLGIEKYREIGDREIERDWGYRDKERLGIER